MCITVVAHRAAHQSRPPHLPALGVNYFCQIQSSSEQRRVCLVAQTNLRNMSRQMQAQLTKNTITLKGSAQIVAEFFNYAVNSILYQRGVYPPESFEAKKNYGLTLWSTIDESLSKYLSTVLLQMKEWLAQGTLQKLVLVIADVESKDVQERWTFDIETNKEVVNGGLEPEKSEKDIQQEIQAIIRQITASVTFLPLLDGPCTFDLLVYTDVKSDVPEEWEESDARQIRDAAVVEFRGFSTKVHSVKALVSYKQTEELC